MHFPESPAKCLFLPCFHIHCSSSVLWDALLAEVVLVLLTNKIPSIYSIPVQLQRFTLLFYWLYIFFLVVRVTATCSPVTHLQNSSVRMFLWIPSMEYSAKWME